MFIITCIFSLGYHHSSEHKNTLHQMLSSETQGKDIFEEPVSQVDNDLKHSSDVSSVQQPSAQKKTCLLYTSRCV